MLARFPQRLPGGIVLGVLMRITKLEHATLIVEEGGHRLVVDPGSLTTPLVDARGIDAVVITHEHGDHWSPNQLQRILDLNGDVRVFGPAGVAKAAEGFPVETVSAGDTVEVGPFTLRFFGGQHAVIHPSIPVVDNVGVLINDRLYYPGDSFTIPEGVEVDTLAVPAGAPWLKIAEVIDYVDAVKPKRSFPTHYGVLSAAGLALSNDRIKAVTEAHGGQHYALSPDDVLDI
jgi:L-ascorbate metabolism protein UlaG (beta-lactamase superfamily)